MKSPSTNDIDQQLETWKSCEKCQLHVFRTQVVLGSGNSTDPKIMIIGQSPGETEDKQGKPFVGKVSWHLNQALKASKINREQDCYVTNSVVCRPWMPSSNRNIPPSMNSLKHCRERLLLEYNRIKNSVEAIVLVGKEAYIAWHMHEQMAEPSFNPARVRMGDVIGWSTGLDNIKTYTVYHPSYIARQGKAEIARRWLNNWVEISSSVFPERFS